MRKGNLYSDLKIITNTALEVETQVQFLLLALLVGELLEPEVINTQILNRIEVMLFGLALLVEGELRAMKVVWTAGDARQIPGLRRSELRSGNLWPIWSCVSLAAGYAGIAIFHRT